MSKIWIFKLQDLVSMQNARRERCVPRGDDQSRVTSTARGDAVGVGVRGLFTERTGGVERVE